MRFRPRFLMLALCLAATSAPAASRPSTVAELLEDDGENLIKQMFSQQPGYFDPIYFGRPIEQLDAIDATGLSSSPPPQLKAEDLERLWSQLASDDAPRAYLAIWTLVAAPEQSVLFLKKNLLWSKT